VAETGPSLPGRAVAVLLTAGASQKALAVRQMAADWRAGRLAWPGNEVAVPHRPARPEKPELLAPRAMKRRGPGSIAGRIALLHALAHIELNAIDLACDLLARFPADVDLALPPAFADDWVKVADEEGKHFLMLEARLAELGASYGDLPAHDGLWQAAEATAHDLGARLAIVPLVHEARGLDVTPQISARDEVILHVHPTVSEVSEQIKQIGGEPVPLAASTIRESDSIVKARSGQIIVIGGLMQNSSSDVNAGVPWLRRIPGVGNLFKQKSRSSIKSELIILLKPMVVAQGLLNESNQRMGEIRDLMRQRG